MQLLKKAASAIIVLSGVANLNVSAQQSQYKGVVGKSLAESKEWWPEPVKAPQNAPNIVWIML